jgi:hypothetical protein
MCRKRSAPRGSHQRILTKELDGEPSNKSEGRDDPQRGDDVRGSAAHRASAYRARSATMLVEEWVRYEFYRQKDAQRHNDEVVDVAEDGHKIGDKVDRGQGIGGDHARHEFGVPGNARITRREPQREYVGLEVASPGS